MSKEEIFELSLAYVRLMFVTSFRDMLKSLEESGGIIILPQATSAEQETYSEHREFTSDGVIIDKHVSEQQG